MGVIILEIQRHEIAAILLPMYVLGILLHLALRNTEVVWETGEIQLMSVTCH